MDARIVEMLNSLVELDQDAVRAYDQAITACDVMDVEIGLREFREQHERHVRILTARLLAEGEHVIKEDEKGYLLEGFASQMAGVEEALKGLRQDEELTNRAYRSVLAHELPADVREVVECAYNVEKHHLSWIQSAIDAMPPSNAPDSADHARASVSRCAPRRRSRTPARRSRRAPCGGARRGDRRGLRGEVGDHAEQRRLARASERLVARRPWTIRSFWSILITRAISRASRSIFRGSSHLGGARGSARAGAKP